MPLLDKLCSGVSGWDIFSKEFQAPISDEIERVHTERMATGEGTLNTAAIYQQVRKNLWESLPTESKHDLEKKAQALNSDVQT